VEVQFGLKGRGFTRAVEADRIELVKRLELAGLAEPNEGLGQLSQVRRRGRRGGGVGEEVAHFIIGVELMGFWGESARCRETKNDGTMGKGGSDQ
jgi:hypothetical protein